MANAEDDSASVIRPRLRAAEANLDHVLDVEEESQDPLPFSVPDSLAGLEETLRRISPPTKLIVIDPVEAFYSRWVSNKDNQSVRRALKPLGDMAARLGLAVVLVQHMPKDNNRPAIYRFSGSIGVVGAARAGYLVTRHGALSILSPAKTNWGRSPESLGYQMEEVRYDDIITSRIRWRMPPLDLNADDVVLGAEEGPSEVRDAMQFLRDVLAGDGKSVSSREIHGLAKDRGIQPKPLARAAKLLGVIYTQSQNGKGPTWYWSLPTEHIIFDVEAFK